MEKGGREGEWERERGMEEGRVGTGCKRVVKDRRFRRKEGEEGRVE